MSETNIMSGIKQIPYGEVNIMKTLEMESIKSLGKAKWDEIISGIEVPTDEMEHEKANNVMRIFLRRYDTLIPPDISADIFCRVKHGLKHNSFTWAREMFLQFNDIDKFCAAMRRETIEGFTQGAENGSHFHGQPVDDTVLQFVIDQPFLLYGARDGNRIVAVAIPCETKMYLMETDKLMKQYYACHCQFARKSILQKEGTVSKTLCHCSLGHTKVFWEAALATPLSGEVKSSVLGDELLCRFEILLPDEIMKKYTNTGGLDFR